MRQRAAGPGFRSVRIPRAALCHDRFFVAVFGDPDLQLVPPFPRKVRPCPRHPRRYRGRLRLLFRQFRHSSFESEMAFSGRNSGRVWKIGGCGNWDAQPRSLPFWRHSTARLAVGFGAASGGGRYCGMGRSRGPQPSRAFALGLCLHQQLEQALNRSGVSLPNQMLTSLAGRRRW
jgi:hypothetical protein